MKRSTRKKFRTSKKPQLILLQEAIRIQQTYPNHRKGLRRVRSKMNHVLAILNDKEEVRRAKNEWLARYGYGAPPIPSPTFDSPVLLKFVIEHEELWECFLNFYSLPEEFYKRISTR